MSDLIPVGTPLKQGKKLINDKFATVDAEINENTTRINNIVSSDGSSNVEIVDARYSTPTTTTYPNLKDRLDTEYVTVDNKMGDLSNLQTTDKSSLVSAINEHDSEIGILTNDLDALTADIAYFPRSFKQAGDADDTASINRALAHVNSLGGGKVKIPFRTTQYVISSPLLIYSNTTLEVDNFATIFLANNSNCVMLWNANKTANWNITRIDKNIKLVGGIWDCNGANQTPWTPANEILTVGFFFGGVENITFKPTKIINTARYGCLFGNVKNLLIEDVEINLDLQTGANNDGIHVLGPSEKITVQHCKIRSHDNCIAFTTDDADHGIYTSFGEVSNIYINDIVLNNYDGGQGMLLLSANHPIKNATIENISGKAAYLINLGTFDFGPGDYDNLTIKNANIERVDADTWAQSVMMYGKFGRVNLENINIQGNDNCILGTQGVSVFTRAGTGATSVIQLNIKNINMSNVNGQSGTSFDEIIIADNVYVEELNINGLTSKYNGMKCNPVDLRRCTIGNAKISNINADNAPNGGLVIDNANIKKISYENVSLDAKSVNRINHMNGEGTPLVKELVVSNCGLINITSQQLIGKFVLDGTITAMAVPTDTDYYRIGQIVSSANPQTLGYAGWVCTVAGSPYNVAWQANKSYVVGDVVRISNWLIKCVVAGTSASTQPTVVVTDFIDGTVTWRYMYDGIATFKLFGAIVP